jgi:hypothetical protein
MLDGSQLPIILKQICAPKDDKNLIKADQGVLMFCVGQRNGVPSFS